MEKVLNILCPCAELKASPHIETKLKWWKIQYSIIYDIINTSGFAWNDVKKCIEVDSNEAWETYVQHHKNAVEWRNKSFLLFDRLANFFGKDHANGKGAKVPSEMMEKQGNNEVDASDDNDTEEKRKTRGKEAQVMKTEL
ncbi:PREDICTED: uncharacterized protein LOC107881672 [Prunus mume]|uniref:Uncharacterized protein LOC107881672 n=1 Tax=Prunus mume TaxID=102107 RepID=A0ABM1LVR6_PRUMU|nr:PREDICTED: uncharacterized protein LOC107881672 [Prunus mume]